MDDNPILVTVVSVLIVFGLIGLVGTMTAAPPTDGVQNPLDNPGGSDERISDPHGSMK